MKRSTKFALAVALLVASTIGIAFAAIPDSSTGIISGCIGKAGGNLRVIDAEAGAKCSPGETPLSWNIAGVTGATGDRGPSEVWPGNFIYLPDPLNTRPSGTLTWADYEAFTTLSSVALPAGAFSVSAKTSLVEQQESGALFDCILIRDGLQNLLDNSWEMATTGNPANLALQATLTLSEPHVVSLKCASSGPQTYTVDPKLSAIQVGVVHRPPPVPA